MTCHPSRMNASAAFTPMNPAPPVITTVLVATAYSCDCECNGLAAGRVIGPGRYAGGSLSVCILETRGCGRGDDRRRQPHLTSRSCTAATRELADQSSSGSNLPQQRL